MIKRRDIRGYPQPSIITRADRERMRLALARSEAEARKRILRERLAFLGCVVLAVVLAVALFYGAAA